MRNEIVILPNGNLYEVCSDGSVRIRKAPRGPTEWHYRPRGLFRRIRHTLWRASLRLAAWMQRRGLPSGG